MDFCLNILIVQTNSEEFNKFMSKSSNKLQANKSRKYYYTGYLTQTEIIVKKDFV
jgi:hypothetical protein